MLGLKVWNTTPNPGFVFETEFLVVQAFLKLSIAEGDLNPGLPASTEIAGTHYQMPCSFGAGI